MSIFSAIGGLFGIGDQNPADAASQYYNQISPMEHQQFDPYIQHGASAYGQMQPQMNQMMNDPSGMLASIGKGYTQSPGYQYQLNQAMGGAAAMGGAQGMANTPANQQQAMTVAQGLASQDYDKYMSNALGLHTQGMDMAQNLYNTGYNASGQLADNLGSALESQGNLAYAGQASQNNADSSLLGGIGGLMRGHWGGLYQGLSKIPGLIDGSWASPG